MFSFATQAHVEGLRARDVYEFFLDSTESDFQAWFPGVHLGYRVVRGAASHVGRVIQFDQNIGPYRVRETARIVEAVPYRRFVRQVIRGFQLPIFVTFDLADEARGVRITHTIQAGHPGLGRVLDPLYRLYFTRKFLAALDEHVLAELLLLPNVVKRTSDDGSKSAVAR